MIGSFDLNVSRSVAPPSLYLLRYSVSAFRASISASTRSCTGSAFRVVSSMNFSALASFSQAGGPSGESEESTAI